MTDEVVTLDVQHRDDIVIARLSGELDIATADSIGMRIAEAVPTSARGVVVDMSALEFIDSSGVAMLFALARRVGSRRQDLRLVAPVGGAVARVLDLVEFDRAAPVDADVETALGAFPVRARPPSPPRPRE